MYIIDLDLEREISEYRKIKQYDDRTLQLNIFQGGLAYDLTGATVILSGANELGDGIVQTTGYKITNNIVTIDLLRDFTRKSGILKLELQIIKDSKQISTFNFTLQVVASVLEGANLEPSLVIDSIEILTNLITDANEIISTGGVATKAEVNVISSQLADMENEIEQDNFIELIKNHDYVNKMYVTTNSYEQKNFSILYELGNGKCLSYTTLKNGDDFSIINEGAIGTKGETLREDSWVDYDSKTGTWEELYPPSIYAKTVGATITKTFKQKHIAVFTTVDTRGGIWEFVLDGDNSKKVTISTYNATSDMKLQLLFRDLDDTINHTVVGTFKGDDPLNQPSTGVGTSRGWIWGNPNNVTSSGVVKKAFCYVSPYLTNTNKTDYFQTSSNKEFAFFVNETGVSETGYFLPWHNNQPTSYDYKPTEFYINGLLVDNTTLKDTFTLETKQFKIIQYLSFRKPSTITEVAIAVITTTFNQNGTITTDSKFTWKRNMDIQYGYVNMLPVKSDFAKELKTSTFTSYPTIKTDGTRTNLLEKDVNKSYAFVNPNNKDYAILLTITTPKLTYRKDKVGRAKEPVFIEHRNTTMQKLYPQVFENAKAIVDETYRFGGMFAVVNINNVYDLI